MTEWVSDWQVILLNFSLLVPIRNYFLYSLAVFLVYLLGVSDNSCTIKIIFFLNLFYYNSHTEVYLGTYSVFIKKKITSLYFICLRISLHYAGSRDILLQSRYFFILYYAEDDCRYCESGFAELCPYVHTDLKKTS